MARSHTNGETTLEAPPNCGDVNRDPTSPSILDPLVQGCFRRMMFRHRSIHGTPAACP